MMEAFFADLLLAAQAEPVFAPGDSFEGGIDLKELPALGVGQAEEEFLRIGAFGLVGQILGDVGFDDFTLVLGFAKLPDDFAPPRFKGFLDGFQLFLVHDAPFTWHKIFLS